MATVKIIVHEARDLPVMDRTTGLADPYVHIKLDEMANSTSIIRRTRNPVWEQEIRFDTADLLVLQEDPLEIRVYDHDIISRDDIVGIVLLDCNTIIYRDTPTVSGWFPLHDTNSGLHGDIRLTIHIKFHAAENPLAPLLPDRIVRRLQVASSQPWKSLVAAVKSPGGDLAAQHSMSVTLPTSLSAPSPKTEPSSAMWLYNSSTVMTSGNGTTPNNNNHGGGTFPSITFDASQLSPLLYTAANSSAATFASQADLIPFFVEQNLDPLATTRLEHPTLAAEEEGVLIFSAWRLDPSVFRVESTKSMTEELIVKADPEHVRFTGLRSSRSINEARLVQLFKLSGKVRRQLARKVVELQCNAVLGYVEQFDMEPNGIIVRAYGTPCVVSQVKYVKDREVSKLIQRNEDFLHFSAAAFPTALLSPAAAGAATIAAADASVLTGGHTPNTVPSTAGGGRGETSAMNSVSSTPLHGRRASTQVGPSASFRLEQEDGGGGGARGGRRSAGETPGGTAEQRGEGAGERMHGSHPPSLTLGPAVVPAVAGSVRSVPESPSGPSMIVPVMTPSTTTTTVTVMNNNNNNTSVNFMAVAEASTPLEGDLKGLVAVKSAVAAAGGGAMSAAPARVSILLLTVKDLPAGVLHHIGGYISARSVKIVSKVKSKQMISQERDAWWMELREELRANARAFHCNAILGYEEEARYHEDVVLLSLCGTAVMIDPALTSLRAGPEHIFTKYRQRVEARRSCALLHLYQGTKKRGPQSPHGAGLISTEVGELLHHHVCGMCHQKPVPQVLLAACALPIDLSCDAPPRMLHVVVSRVKRDVKGVDLAMAASQALPYIEYALHKQLLFNLRLYRMNACFSIRVAIVVGPDAIVGTLTGTGCRLAGLPVPTPPKMQVLDPAITNKESVIRLKDVIRARGRRFRRPSGSSSSSSSSSSRTSSAASRGSSSGSVDSHAASAHKKKKKMTISAHPSRKSSAAKLATTASTANSATVASPTSSTDQKRSGVINGGGEAPLRPRHRSRTQEHRCRHHHRRHADPHRSSISGSSSTVSGESGEEDSSTGSSYSGSSYYSDDSYSYSYSGSASRSSSRSSSSSSRSASSVRRGSDRDEESWVSSESSESDEDGYTGADNWGNAAGRQLRKATDYIVKIDDEEEADMILGMADATSFEDSVLLTIPYVPDSANSFEWSERLVLHRRYRRWGMAGSAGALEGQGGAGGGPPGSGAYLNNSMALLPGMSVSGLDPAGGGGAGGGGPTGAGGGMANAGPRALTTRLLNDYCADAKRAFVHVACRVAMRMGVPLRLRIVATKVDLVFPLNTTDLQVRLEGCLMVATKAGLRRLQELEDRAFRICMNNSVELIKEELVRRQRGGGPGWQSTRSGSSGQRRAPAQPPHYHTAHPMHSSAPRMQVSSSLPGDPSNASSGLQRRPSSGEVAHHSSTQSPTAKPVQGRRHSKATRARKQERHDAKSSHRPQFTLFGLASAPPAPSPDYLDARRMFVTSNAPFSLPHVMKIVNVASPRLWSGAATALSEDASAATAHHSRYNTSTYAEYREGRSGKGNVVTRQWNAFVRSAGQSIKSLVDRATGSSGSRQGAGREREEGYGRGQRFTTDDVASFGGSGLANDSAATATATSSDFRTNLSQPALRLPASRHELIKAIPAVTFTPLDYVPGKSIVRYLGRLSHHIIREDLSIYTPEQLSDFFRRVELEIQCVVQSFVRLLGGNALLKHQVLYHEVVDSDGSGSAFIFATVTGDVVQVTDVVFEGEDEEDDGEGEGNEAAGGGEKKGAVTTVSSVSSSSDGGLVSLEQEDTVTSSKFASAPRHRHTQHTRHHKRDKRRHASEPRREYET